MDAGMTLLIMVALSTLMRQTRPESSSGYDRTYSVGVEWMLLLYGMLNWVAAQ